MQLSGVKAFVAVAQCGSMTEAAAKLGFTQSAISRQVADFERYVGTKSRRVNRRTPRLTVSPEPAKRAKY